MSSDDFAAAWRKLFAYPFDYRVFCVSRRRGKLSEHTVSLAMVANYYANNFGPFAADVCKREIVTSDPVYLGF